MGDSPKLTTNNQCSKCKHRLLMLDGSFWCDLTTKPVGKGFLAHCPNFELGNTKSYKPEPKVVTPKQEERKIKVKEVKPKEIKAKNLSINL